MDNNKPRSREKNIVSGGGNVNKRGSGLGTGPVGTGNSHGSHRSSTAKGVTRGGLGAGILLVIGYLLFSKFSGGSGSSPIENLPVSIPSVQTQSQSQSSGNSSILSTLAQNFDYSTTVSDFTSAATSHSANKKGQVDDTVAKGSRSKYTDIKGNGKDKVTIMVYMCGTDLESGHGMGTSDLSEMTRADISDNVNLLVYTGGCKNWQNKIVSSSRNQIYQVKDGGLYLLEDDMGDKAMTKPETLSEFIKYCNNNYPANRMDLIFWDHGSGSISGYGYDEKHSNAGSMSLSGINRALKDAGIKYDFIGFDACLMATVENALMLSNYADYLIASEETEPGVGWYYTNWLTEFSKNTSMSTLEIGKMIVDDFVDVCDQKCNGQKTTLSVTDLAEISHTVPSELTEFAKSTNELIQNNEYDVVSTARNNTKEFAQSSKIDQIDFVHFAKNLNTDEGKKLAGVLTGAVKYNRTASCVKDAYGLSIYFPLKKASKVDSVVQTYSDIGMDEEYARCIQEFASLEVSGQVSQGGTNSPLSSLLPEFPDSSASSGGGLESILGLLGSMTSDSSSGSVTGSEGIETLLMSFLSDRSMPTEKAAQYLADNYFDDSMLTWVSGENGKIITLPKDQWDLVTGLDLNVFYDDGEGYVDLGLDNIYSFDGDSLIGEYDKTWLSINGQIVPYYHTDTVDDGTNYSIFGYVPAFLNGERVELQLVFDNENPYGYITGAKPVYANGETETVAKSLIGLVKGDKLDFICDYYTYEGEYVDSYLLGEQMTLGDTITIGNAYVGDGKTVATYRFTDIYEQYYWTDPIE